MVQHVRDSLLEECKTSKVLFVKARAFYRLFDQDIKVKVPPCQFASQSEQHYIFAESEGKFDLLVQCAQDIATQLEKPLTIEFRPVKS